MKLVFLQGQYNTWFPGPKNQKGQIRLLVVSEIDKSLKIKK